MHRAPSISPGEAEFYALTNTITETVTIRQLIEELGVVFASATQVFSDSRTARTLAEHGATTHRTRFIHRRWHFAKFYEQDGVIKISPIRGAVNPANVTPTCSPSSLSAPSSSRSANTSWGFCTTRLASSTECPPSFSLYLVTRASMLHTHTPPLSTGALQRRLPPPD